MTSGPESQAVRLDLAIGEALEAFRLHKEEAPSFLTDQDWVGETSPHPSRRSLLARGLLVTDGDRVVASEDLTRLVGLMSSATVVVRVHRRTPEREGLWRYWCDAAESIRSEVTPEGVVSTLRFATVDLPSFITVEVGFQADRESSVGLEISLPAGDYGEYLQLLSDGEAAAAARVLSKHGAPASTSLKVVESLSSSFSATNIAVADRNLPEDPRNRIVSWIEGDEIGLIAVERSEIDLESPEPEPDEPIQLTSVSDAEMFVRVMRIFTTLQEEPG